MSFARVFCTGQVIEIKRSDSACIIRDFCTAVLVLSDIDQGSTFGAALPKSSKNASKFIIFISFSIHSVRHIGQ